jgi:hypothetical protein
MRAERTSQMRSEARDENIDAGRTMRAEPTSRLVMYIYMIESWGWRWMNLRKWSRLQQIFWLSQMLK